MLDLGVLETGRGRGGSVKRSVSREGGEAESSPAQASLALEETPSAPKATGSRQPAASRNGGSSQLEQTFRNTFLSNTDNDLSEFVSLQKTFAVSPKSWSVDVKDIDPKTFDLSVKNPDGGEEITHLSAADIMREIAKLDAESAAVLGKIKKLL